MLSNTKVVRVDEYELSSFPNLRLLPALVSQGLSRLSEKLYEAGAGASVSS